MKSKSTTTPNFSVTGDRKAGSKNIIDEYRKKFGKSLIKISTREIIELKNEGRR
jgi:hypothetical protein